MWGALLLGLPFAAWYPRMSKRLKVPGLRSPLPTTHS